MIRKISFFIVLVATLPLAFSQSSNGKPCRAEPTVKDYDGNVYNTVQIGRQCWLRENLRTTHYVDGTLIERGSGRMSGTIPYRFFPNNDADNVKTYGYLYNWVAVMHGSQSSNQNSSGVQGICPKGWHVPSEAEWQQLIKLTGIKHNKRWVVFDVLRLCDNNGDINNNLGYVDKKICNSTGLSLRFAGAFLGYYYTFGKSMAFWSSTEKQSNNYAAFLFIDKHAHVDDKESLDFLSKSNALSVRCLRD